MFRRIADHGSAAVATAIRCYTPSEQLKKLYASDFDKAEFPTNIVPSDSVLFAKFLYKAAESNNNFESISKDLSTIAAAVPQLPVFWERTCRVAEIKEFKGLSEPTTFTLEWMQSNGMLDLLPDVAEVYEAYANAKMKRVVAKVYVASGKTGDRATIDQAKQVAEKAAKESKELAGLKVTYKVVVDRAIVSGFAVDMQGIFLNHAVGRQSEARAVDETDFTAIPAPRLPPTKWAENIETEVLRKYLDSVSQFDAEELKNGV